MLVQACVQRFQQLNQEAKALDPPAPGLVEYTGMSASFAEKHRKVRVCNRPVSGLWTARFSVGSCSTLMQRKASSLQSMRFPGGSLKLPLSLINTWPCRCCKIGADFPTGMASLAGPAQRQR